MRQKLVSAAILAVASSFALLNSAYAQDGTVSTGISYSSRLGTLGTVGFEATDLAGGGLSVGAKYQAGQSGDALSFSSSYIHELAEHPKIGLQRLVFELNAGSTDWDADAFARQFGRLDIRYQASPRDDIILSFGAFAQIDRIDRVPATASPLVRAAIGSSDTGGFSFRLDHLAMQGASLPEQGREVAFSLNVAPFGTRNWAEARLDSAFARPIGNAAHVVLRASGGHRFGLNGQNVALLDRYLLGGADGPRGFDVGGVGPRDVAGAIDSPLGGDNFATFSLEGRRAFGQRVEIGAFVDAGLTWGLGGAPVGASGVIDDTARVRASTGLAIYVPTQVGTLGISLAEPIQSQPNDAFNQVSIGFNARF